MKVPENLMKYPIEVVMKAPEGLIKSTNENAMK